MATEALTFNIQLLEKRGANLCGQDWFSIQACDHCQGHYLYNAELKDVYFDADDLAKRFFKIPGLSLPPCRYCSAIRWDFSTTGPDRVQVQAGPWSWTLASRAFVFTADDS